MKLWQVVRDWFKDIKEFIRIRREQRRLYGPIITDLETINALSTALNEQIAQFSKKWNLYPEIQAMLKEYKKYVIHTQKIYQTTRKDILNSVLAERNRDLISDDAGKQSSSVRRQEDTIPTQARQVKEKTPKEILVDGVSVRKPFLGNILSKCDIQYEESSIIIVANNPSKIVINTILKNKELIESVCHFSYGANVTVDIVSKG